ncbi:protein tesmin/TSO1-like CXC 2 isoform X1 [Chenopodium quinoa]|uniref:protein tesmin/TSO1-like CXC 2 isoform X1 n=1 Tax=Chenopodium quinoa TaxID=63459 RepID=UPI000B78CB27|nr:protein tesmin/TSO1-like CXC 2 isoform X1 [Chenopodium quinoa]
MDTPERNQIGTPVSKFEESPFSNFINSLSPINPTKTIHVSQTFGSLSFTSPPSVFTSPHVSFQKDNKFLRRHLVSDLARHQLSSDEGNKDSITEEDGSTEHHPESLPNVQIRGEGGEGSAKPLEDASDCATELPRELKYDSGSPRHCKAVNSCGNETGCEPNTSAALIQFIQEPSVRGTFDTESNAKETNHDNEEEGCDWQSLISGSSDLFIFDSPNVTETSKGSLQKSQEEETNVFASLLARFPSEQAYDLQTSLQVGSASCLEAHETREQSTQPTEATELNQIDQPSENLESASVNEFFSGEKPGKQPFSNIHRGLRRRCLTFEIPRTKRSIDSVLFSSSMSSLPNEENPPSSNRLPITPRVDPAKRIMPGIGLHLNALAGVPKGSGISNQELLSTNSQDPLMNSLTSSSLREDVGPAENIVEMAEDSSQASVYAANEDLNSNSPKKKRRKFETIGEGESSCKRCNCKKSKCLKLYCECFAAGVYCVEPCSCQDCFNKPIHEETVLATRKQIESRNPLAFAPKVIRTADSAQEVGEDTTRTPASARHKRGCNCKKSNCLKKYCECYQGGVGCSINCRCEGCKNAFGRKDGSSLIGTEAEMEKIQASEKSMQDKSSDIHAFHNDDDQNSEFAIPMTPSRLFRPSVPVATSSKGKPPRSSLGIITSSSGLHQVDGPGRSTFLRTLSRPEKHFKSVADEIPTVLQNCSPPSSGLKTLSPNSRRISPPHHANGQTFGHKSSRKLILQSIPAFPSLSPRR